jgi:hypothetical protein
MKKVKPTIQLASGRQFTAASELKFANSKELAFGSDGHLNASDNKDLFQQIARLIEVSNTGNRVMMDNQLQEQTEKARIHREAVMAAFEDENAHKELGEVIVNELRMTNYREGFATRFLGKQELTQGQWPMAQVRNLDVVAGTYSSAAMVEHQLIRDKYLWLQEFYITARIFIEERDLNVATTDLLEEKYIEGLNATMVQMDRFWKKLVDSLVGTANTLTIDTSRLSPTTLTATKSKVTNWGLTAYNWLIASDLWQDIVSDPGFQAIIDPVSKNELLLTGKLGEILGMTITSDAFRHPEHKVLNAGEHYVVSQQITHGLYTDRGGVTALPLDSTQVAIPGRGWMLSQTTSMGVVNNRSIAKGVRI